MNKRLMISNLIGISLATASTVLIRLSWLCELKVNTEWPECLGYYLPAIPASFITNYMPDDTSSSYWTLTIILSAIFWYLVGLGISKIWSHFTQK